MKKLICRIFHRKFWYIKHDWEERDPMYMPKMLMKIHCSKCEHEV